jgi:transcriptional regulator with XRE-family HTH domain
MPRSQLAGSRIRSRRADLGLRQAELARACGISPSYLNLIEHNRRRIGGKLLNDLARELSVDPAALSEGAGAARLQALQMAAGAQSEIAVEADRTEDFVARFPGWATLVSAQSERINALERMVASLADRMAHDPYLSASMHDVLSTVTAIRSTSAILADDAEIPPDWRARFHRNLYEDSRRLADASQALVGFLDAGGDTSRDLRTPQDEIDAWLSARHFHFPELEQGGQASTDDVVGSAGELTSTQARQMAVRHLDQYRQDAQRVPLDALKALTDEHGIDPSIVAATCNVDLACAMRRLAELPPDASRPPAGLIICDASGALTFRKQIDGFVVPRFDAGCPLWPMFQALTQPMQPIASKVAQPGVPERRFRCFAIGQPIGLQQFGRPVVQEATMLIVPEGQSDPAMATLDVGVTCRICPREDCPARREPSILSAQGF